VQNATNEPGKSSQRISGSVAALTDLASVVQSKRAMLATTFPKLSDPVRGQ
jgi:hypothetical protein